MPVFSQDTFDEFRSVLSYPKFSLTPREIDTLLQDEVVPFCEVVDIEDEIVGVCRNRADDKFLSCAVAEKIRDSALFLVDGGWEKRRVNK